MIDDDPDIKERAPHDELRERYGVTGAQAEGLLDHFGSVEAVADANHDALLKVPGIGPKAADSIAPKSTRLRWIQAIEGPRAVIPTYTGVDGYRRHYSERNTDPDREPDILDRF